MPTGSWSNTQPRILIVGDPDQFIEITDVDFPPELVAYYAQPGFTFELIRVLIRFQEDAVDYTYMVGMQNMTAGGAPRWAMGQVTSGGVVQEYLGFEADLTGFPDYLMQFGVGPGTATVPRFYEFGNDADPVQSQMGLSNLRINETPKSQHQFDGQVTYGRAGGGLTIFEFDGFPVVLKGVWNNPTVRPKTTSTPAATGAETSLGAFTLNSVPLTANRPVRYHAHLFIQQSVPTEAYQLLVRANTVLTGPILLAIDIPNSIADGFHYDAEGIWIPAASSFTTLFLSMQRIGGAAGGTLTVTEGVAAGGVSNTYAYAEELGANSPLPNQVWSVTTV